jgi:peptide deformylase
MKNKVLLVNSKELRQVAIPVNEASIEYVNKTLLPKMVEVMKAEKGIGLAANQVGDPHSVFILDTNGELGIYLNPLIVQQSDLVDHEEGCLSIPGAIGKVKRYNKLTLMYQDEALQNKEVSLEGIAAIAVQHEVDHLNGLLYIDHLGETSKMMVIKRHKKFLKLRSRMGV